MKTIRNISAILLAWLLAFAVSAQTNVLRVPAVTYPAGKTLSMPVELENASDIVGIQFEIQLPYGLNKDEQGQYAASLNQQRTNGHTVSVRQTSYNTYNGVRYYYYRVIVTSADNTKLQGSSGTLMTFDIDLPETLTNGQQLPVYLTKESVILGDRDGNNVVTSQENGSITVEVVPRPDLVPDNVRVQQTLADPGATLDFSWTVQNVGDTITGAGWTEKLFLENEAGTRVYVGTTAYEGTLAAGASVSRTHTLTLDEYPGISGNCRPVVQLVPSADCGEIALNQGNNTGYPTTYDLRVQKYLVLTPYKGTVRENNTGSHSCELRRTGDLSKAESFNVTSDDPRVSFNNDGVIRFDKNVSRVYFSFRAVDNTDINPDPRVLFTVNKAKNNGYAALTDTLYIEDDDLIPLTLTLDKEDYNEGEYITAAASVPARYYEGKLSVNLTIEQNKRFKLPARIDFEDGATTAMVRIPILQDNEPANDVTVKLTGTAEHHQKAEVLFVLHDDDVPAISMTISPTTVSEGAGPAAFYGTLTRQGVTTNKITVKLSDDGNNDIYYSTKTLTLPAGTTTVNFTLGVRDNAVVDGDRTVNIKAGVYITDCNCSAIGDKQANVTIPVTITDNDGPALTVTSSKATILEGDAAGTVLTITRNTTDNTEALTVSLSTDATDVTFPATVTIPAGQSSTTATFAAKSNSTEEGDRTVSIIASATGFSSGATWLLISDRTLPDAIIESFTLSTSATNAGGTIIATIKVGNIGAAPLPQGTDVQILQNGTNIMTLTTPSSIPMGSSLTLTPQLTTTNVPGDYQLSAVVNAAGGVSELLYINNTSEALPLTLQSLYNYTIAADKAVYKDEDVITLSGKVSAVGSASVSGIRVEPYVIFNGLRTKFDCITDQLGNFSIVYERPASYRGLFIIGACNPGEELRDTLGTFNVYGLERVGTSYLKHEVFRDEPYAGYILLHNLSAQPLHHVTPVLSGATENYTFNVESIAELAGYATDTVRYTLVGNDISAGKDWDRITITFNTDEGATLDVQTYNYTRLHEPKLVVSTNSITTTVTKGTSRTYPITLTNGGQGATGKISVSLPSGLDGFISLVTPAEMPSMEYGDSATIMLRFNPGNFDVNIYQKGNIAINCENGGGIPVYFNVKVVSESKGALRVQVQDENTIYGNKDGEHPYVKGAMVRLLDYNTGATVVEGSTPDDTADGILFENINEGVYQLYVTAEKHDSYRQNLVVSPGETTTHLATVSYEAVSVSWDVVETEVEDEYQIVSTLTYETQVPVPVVRMTMPDTIAFDRINYGQATLFNIVLRNEGLIAAEDCYVKLPEYEGYSIVPLVAADNFTIGARQSYIIPVRITRTAQFVTYGNSTNVYGPTGILIIEDNGGGGTGTGTGDPGGDPNGGGGSGTGGGSGGSGGNGGSGGSGSGGSGGSGSGGSGGSGGGGGSGHVPCGGGVDAGYSWMCGSSKKSRSIGQSFSTLSTDGDCTGGGGGGYYGGGGGVGSPGGGSSGGSSAGGGTSYTGYLNVPCPEYECDPSKCVTAWIPYWDCGATVYYGFKGNWKNAGESLKGCIVGFIPVVGTANSVATCLGTAYECLVSSLAREKNPTISGEGVEVVKALRGTMKSAKTFPALVQSFYNKVNLYSRYLGTYLDFLQEVYGAKSMITHASEDMVSSLLALDARIAELDQTGELYGLDPYTDIPDVLQLGEVDTYRILAQMHSHLAIFRDFDVRKYVERQRNTRLMEKGLLPTNENFIRLDYLAQLEERHDSCMLALVNMGIATWEELVESANADWLEYTQGASSNVCASVKLEIEQRLVLTRQAFRGTLTMENNSATDLEDIDLSLVVSNMLGEQATSHEFQINFEGITGFTGSVEGPWKLASGNKGVATILFIPTKYAAPDTLTTYAFGGNLTWFDGSTYQNRSLYPVSLQVKPSPELDLTYFMQRDIYGDNPLTKDVVEPVIPAEFSVLIHNKGKGDATNVRMLTKQPRIVDNEKGLLVDFAILSSSVNGGEKALPLDSTIATQFGDIAAGTCSYATWDLTCSLLGHFTSYDVKATHLTSYGNPDLTLLDQITIHELIHSVNATLNGKKYRAWVTNDVEDGHDEPDHIYFSNGTDEKLKTLSDVTTVERLSSTQYRVSVTVPQKEWFYTSIANPGGMAAKIVGITLESDGSALDPANFWTTQYTMQDGFDPLPDNRLHIVDFTDAPATRSYIVEFEPIPEVRLDVVSIDTLPSADKIVEQPIEQLTVRFNKGVDASTFTRDDIVLRYEGEKQTTALPIAAVAGSDSIFTLNTSALTANGYYVLQVKTDSIRDLEGYLGYNGLQVKWMLFKDGLVHYNIFPWPLGTGGDVTILGGSTTSPTAVSLYGSANFGTVLVLTATPAPGYTFSYWGTTNKGYTGEANSTGSRRLKDEIAEAEATLREVDIEEFSTENPVSIELNKVQNIRAVFKPIPYKVDVVCDETAATLNVGSGIYDYGTTLTLKAVPNEGFTVTGYLVNGTLIEGSETNVTVEGVTTIEVATADLRPKNIILNEAVDYTPADVPQANITLSRSFVKGEWNAIVLPCAVADPETVFGVGTQVARLTGIWENDLQFALVSEMEANVPYLIKPGSINASGIADGTNKLAVYSIPGTATLVPDEETPTFQVADIDFIGTYTDFAIPTGDSNYVLSADGLVYVDASSVASTGRFRGYLHVTDSNASLLGINVYDPATGLPLLPVGGEWQIQSPVYDTQGRLVRTAGSTAKLRPGIYITRGHKFIVR